MEGQSKRQKCASTSTTEAELTAAQFGLKSSGIPTSVLMTLMRNCYNLQAGVLRFMVDNKAMIEIIRTGRNVTMRHIFRTQGVSISFLHEQCNAGYIAVQYVQTSVMAGDIYTKGFIDKVKWNNLLEQNNIFRTGDGPVSLEAISLLSSVIVQLEDDTTQLRRPRTEESEPLPDPLLGWNHGKGWHDEEGFRYLVVAEPKLMRVCSDETLPVRTVWLKYPAGWRLEEDHVSYLKLSKPTYAIKDWVSKAVFVFSPADDNVLKADPDAEADCAGGHSSGTRSGSKGKAAAAPIHQPAPHLSPMTVVVNGEFWMGMVGMVTWAAAVLMTTVLSVWLRDGWLPLQHRSASSSFKVISQCTAHGEAQVSLLGRWDFQFVCRR